ncbi:DMT family transporter [Mycolicibacterium thermoresistibile]
MLGQGLAVLLAFCAAVFAAVGIVVRQRATMDVPPEKGVSTMMFATLVRRRVWWIGTGAAVIGYAFQAGALATGSLILVQPILVSALLFALPLSARLAARRVGRSDWMWAAVLTAALAAFVLIAKPKPGDYQASIQAMIVVAVVCVAGVTVSVAMAMRSLGWRRALLLATAVGVMFGVVAVLTKVWMHKLVTDGIAVALSSPLLYLLILIGVLATLLQQSAFHAGSLQASVPTMLVLEPVVAVALGAAVLGEHLDINGWEPVPLAIAGVAMFAATVALGRNEGAHEERLEEAALAEQVRT